MKKKGFKRLKDNNYSVARHFNNYSLCHNVSKNSMKILCWQADVEDKTWDAHKAIT